MRIIKKVEKNIIRRGEKGRYEKFVFDKNNFEKLAKLHEDEILQISLEELGSKGEKAHGPAYGLNKIFFAMNLPLKARSEKGEDDKYLVEIEHTGKFDEKNYKSYEKPKPNQVKRVISHLVNNRDWIIKIMPGLLSDEEMVDSDVDQFESKTEIEFKELDGKSYIVSYVGPESKSFKIDNFCYKAFDPKKNHGIVLLSRGKNMEIAKNISEELILKKGRRFEYNLIKDDIYKDENGLLCEEIYLEYRASTEKNPRKS